MNKISFQEVFKESFELIKSNKNNFGILLFILIFLGFLGEIFSKNPIINGVFITAYVIFFLVISVIGIFSVVNFKNDEEFPENEFLIKKLKKIYWKTLLLELLKAIILIFSLLIILIPFSIILAFIGPKLGNSVNVVIYFAIILFGIPLTMANIIISYSLQLFLIEELKIIESIKNSYYLIKNNLRKAIIIGLKINFFYFAVLLLFYRIKFLGIFVNSIVGLFYILMNTMVYYKLKVKDYYDEDYDVYIWS